MRTSISGLLLAKVVRSRVRRNTENQMNRPRKDDIRRVFDVLCGVIEDEQVSFQGRLGCVSF